MVARRRLLRWQPPVPDRATSRADRVSLRAATPGRVRFQGRSEAESSTGTPSLRSATGHTFGSISVALLLSRNSVLQDHGKRYLEECCTHSGHNLCGVEAAFNGQSYDEKVRFHRLSYIFFYLSLFLVICGRLAEWL